MKKILIMTAGLFVLACNSGKEDEKKVVYSDLVASGLKGDISSIEESPYKTDSTGKIGEMDSCCLSVSEYDANGNSVKWTSKDSKGTVKDEGAIERYENGMWKGQKNMKDGKTTFTMESQMDDKGQYTVVRELDSSGKLEHYYTGITTNEVGEVLSWNQYDKDSVLRGKGEAVYDKHLQTSFNFKDSVGKVKSSSAFKYNDKGEQTEVSNTDVTKDSTTTKVTKYTYDAHDEMGNWTQRTTWDDKGKATKITKRAYAYKSKEAKK